jgi:hypothetical protein
MSEEMDKDNGCKMEFDNQSIYSHWCSKGYAVVDRIEAWPLFCFLLWIVRKLGLFSFIY